MDPTSDTDAEPVADPSPLAAVLHAMADAIAEGASPPGSIDLRTIEPTLQFQSAPAESARG